MSLNLVELASAADQFGVSDEQVRRDHVISHLLALISRELSDEILFLWWHRPGQDPPAQRTAERGP
jgi:hypothetical protein